VLNQLIQYARQVEEEAHAPPQAQAPSHACALQVGLFVWTVLHRWLYGLVAAVGVVFYGVMRVA
jgi:hypothetical protein